MFLWTRGALQASDFLADSEAVHQICSILAARLFNRRRGDTSDHTDKYVNGCAQDRLQREQVRSSPAFKAVCLVPGEQAPVYTLTGN